MKSFIYIGVIVFQKKSCDNGVGIVRFEVVVTVVHHTGYVFPTLCQSHSISIICRSCVLAWWSVLSLCDLSRPLFACPGSHEGFPSVATKS
jgi:hypothetical protein